MSSRTFFFVVLGLLAILLVIGLTLPPVPNDMPANATASGWLSGGLFSAGVLSAGLFSVGIFSAGLFSVGIFSAGLFSIGIFSIGSFACAIWAVGHFVVSKNKHKD